MEMLDPSKFKSPKDLLSTEDFEKYSSYVYPFNLPILHEALKTKLKEDPGYEIWVPLKYYRLATRIKTPGKQALVEPWGILLSNQGRVYSRRPKANRELSVHNDEGYRRVSIGMGKNREEGFLIHRAIACCFIALPEELVLKHPEELHVNHIDGVKDNPALANLEWSTAKGNAEHALSKGLYVPPSGVNHYAIKPVKGIVHSGPNVGYEFLIRGSKEFKQHGFNQGNVSKCCLGQQETHKNCKWVFATEEEIQALAGKEIKV